MSCQEEMEFQVKVPVNVTLYLQRDDAEWMYKDDLAEVVGAVLEAIATPDDVSLQVMTSQGQVNLEYQVNPHWDNLPEDEVELVFEDEAGLFPSRNQPQG